MNIKFAKHLFALGIFVISWVAFPLYAQSNTFDWVSENLRVHPQLSGINVLEKGEHALLARAWLADNAQRSIDVQYFIWSTDNIGILASESLLRAADRGVTIRVIVDDLLIDAEDTTLLALASHPNVHIKVYNPVHSVGISLVERLKNLVTNFSGANQRMHDKTFIVDETIAITGGRNMADEYFDFDHQYNFRDRDALVVGPVVQQMSLSFNQFWESSLSQTIRQLLKDSDILNEYSKPNSPAVNKIYNELHEYAQSKQNFEPEIRQAIQNLSVGFKELIDNMVWEPAIFIHDRPGKNDQNSLSGGGLSSSALAKLIQQAQHTVLIQSPYLILSEEAKRLFKKALQRGVNITVSTNSLLSTDNLQAFSGFKTQRKELLEMGIQVFEYKPFPQIQKQLVDKYSNKKDNPPIFAIHAKTMVIDSNTVFIGTFNLDPRSQNLNTEVGIVTNNKTLASRVSASIQKDMQPENSWPSTLNPDQYAPWLKRLKVLFWQMMPIQSLL